MGKQNKIIAIIISLTIVFSCFFFINFISENVKQEKAKATDYDRTTTFSKIMSKEEIIEYFAENNGVDLKQAEYELFSVEDKGNNNKYRVIYKNISNDTKVAFYTKGEAWNNYYGVKEFLSVAIINQEKSFTGYIFINIEDYSTIFYDIIGDLRDKNAKTTFAKVTGKMDRRNLGELNYKKMYEHIAVSDRAYLY